MSTTQADWSTGTATRQGDLYPPEAIQLAALFKTLTQRELQDVVGGAIDRAQGIPEKADLFNPDPAPRDPVPAGQAIRQTTEPVIRRRVPAVDNALKRLGNPDATPMEQAAAQALLRSYGLAPDAQPAFSLATDTEPKFSHTGQRDEIEVPRDEYAAIAHQIASYPKKIDRGHVFTANNYYLCTDIDRDGNFRIIATLPIEGNQDLINDIRRGIPRTSIIPIKASENINDYVGAIQRAGGRISGDYAPAQGQPAGDGRHDSLHLGQRTDPRADRRASGADNQGQEEVKFSIIGERGAANLDADGKGERMNNRDIAEEMEREGKDARAIRLATGWERGKDGKWRYEMPDGNLLMPARLILQGNVSTLADIWRDPALFTAYPQLRDMKV